MRGRGRVPAGAIPRSIPSPVPGSFVASSLLNARAGRETGELADVVTQPELGHRFLVGLAARCPKQRRELFEVVLVARGRGLKEHARGRRREIGERVRDARRKEQDRHGTAAQVALTGGRGAAVPVIGRWLNKRYQE